MNIVRNIKKFVYFWVAGYFGFFAAFVLKRSQPTIITVTGSSGKTTLLHLFEAQLGDRALFSHKANSAFGIPFHILGLERKSFSFFEWPLFLILAPFKSFRILPKKIYVTEADAERPGEGKFLAKLLKPDILVWLSLEEAHGINYDKLLPEYSFNGLKKAIAHEFGYFVMAAKSLVVLNADNPFITSQSSHSEFSKSEKNPKNISLSGKNITAFAVHRDTVEFDVSNITSSTSSNVASNTASKISIPKLVPRDVGLSALAVSKVMEFLNLPFDTAFKNFDLPPGRSSVLEGLNNTTLVDSSYNATFDGMRAMLDLFVEYPATGEKWLVLGDMVEEGKSEQYEHEQLVPLIERIDAKKIILVGPRLKKFTFPKLSDHNKNMGNVVSFMRPDEAYRYIQGKISGGETILFKGARFLEGIVAKLLKNPADITKLCRQEVVWVERRKAWIK